MYCYKIFGAYELYTKYDTLGICNMVRDMNHCSIWFAMWAEGWNGPKVIIVFFL